VSEAEHTVVAAVLQRSSRLAEVAPLGPEFFEDRLARGLWSFSRGYHRKHGRRNALDLPLARTLLERSSKDVAVELLDLVSDYEGLQPISDAEFRDALASLITDRQRALIRAHGTASLEAVLKGDWRRAKREMRRGLVAVEDADLEDDSPADIRSAIEVEVERREVDNPPPAEVAGGFDVGFSRITRNVTLRRRELVILGGYASDGKTQFSKALAYNANQRSRARVLFVALEMDKREMKVLFVAQHAATLDRRGVDYRAILDGTESARDKKLYHRALDDFEVKKHEDDLEIETASGASLHVWAPRKTIDMDQFVGRAQGIAEDDGLDLVVGDYLELIEPSRDFGQYRLNLKHMAEQGKSLAREVDLLVVMNHQISRKGRDDAEKRRPKHYLMRDLGESSGLERAADTILWIYTDDDLKDERESKVGIAKARKGRTLINGFHVMSDFSRGLVAEIME